MVGRGIRLTSNMQFAVDNIGLRSHMPTRSAMPFVGVKMMDCPDLEKLVRNRKPIQLIDVRSKDDFAAIHIRGHDHFLSRSWQRPISFEDCVQQIYRFVSFLLRGTPRLALPPGC